MSEYSVVPNGQLSEASPFTAKQRLVSSLYEAYCFHEGTDTSWMDKGFSHDSFMDGMRAFGFEDEGYRRSERDMQSLTVSGLLMVMHWKNNKIGRPLLEAVWSRAQFPQSEIVRPLAKTIAASTMYVDPEVTRLEQELLLSYTTLEELEPIDVRPHHIHAAVQPLADGMAAELAAEGHIIGDWNYFCTIRDSA